VCQLVTPLKPFEAMAMARPLVVSDVAALREIVEHCRQPGAGGRTPSDFPLARLTQSQVDTVAGAGLDVEDVYPLTPLQAGMLFHSLVDSSNAYLNQLSMRLTGVPDPGELATAWQRVVTEMHERRVSARVRVLADPAIVGGLRGHFGTRLTVDSTHDDGRFVLDIGFGEVENAALELAGYAFGLEVLDPPEVRRDLAALGARLIERYASPSERAVSARAG
jgi:hypothetical protein